MCPSRSAWGGSIPPQRRQLTLDAVKRLLLRESQSQPLLVVFEDLHWIDSETQTLLEAWLTACRPPGCSCWSTTDPNTGMAGAARPTTPSSVWTPSRRRARASCLWLCSGPMPSLDPLKRPPHRADRGQPALPRGERADAGRDGALTGERGAYRLARAPAIEVPATVQAILAARIDRLAPEDKRLLQAAAVIGKDVPFALLARHRRAARGGRCGAGLAHLQAAEFLYETSLFPDLEYTFKHALTHEVAYGSLLHERGLTCTCRRRRPRRS